MCINTPYMYQVEMYTYFDHFNYCLPRLLTRKLLIQKDKLPRYWCDTFKTSICCKMMESKTVIALITLLTLLLMEQLTYGLFYSDLSFITASFFPDVEIQYSRFNVRWIRKSWAITQDTSWVPFIWVNYQVAFSGAGLQISMGGRNRWVLSYCVGIIVFHWHIVDSIFIFAFAFIRNYYSAVVLRLLWGFCDGHYALIKTLISDYSDKKTIARTSSFMFLSVAIGK